MLGGGERIWPPLARSRPLTFFAASHGNGDDAGCGEPVRLLWQNTVQPGDGPFIFPVAAYRQGWTRPADASM